MAASDDSIFLVLQKYSGVDKCPSPELAFSDRTGLKALRMVDAVLPAAISYLRNDRTKRSSIGLDINHKMQCLANGPKGFSLQLPLPDETRVDDGYVLGVGDVAEYAKPPCRFGPRIRNLEHQSATEGFDL